jgi:molybdate transport system ATP-binding protein/molybdate transport system permease protein
LRSRLREELLSLQGDLPGTTITVTHDPVEAALLADELLILENGDVLQTGRTADVFRRPASETVARLLGAQNPGRGIAESVTRIAVGGGTLLEVAGPALEGGRPVGWSFSPDAARTSACGAYQGLVCDVLSMGMERHLKHSWGLLPVRR